MKTPNIVCLALKLRSNSKFSNNWAWILSHNDFSSLEWQSVDFKKYEEYQVNDREKKSISIVYTFSTEKEIRYNFTLVHLTVSTSVANTNIHTFHFNDLISLEFMCVYEPLSNSDSNEMKNMHTSHHLPHAAILSSSKSNRHDILRNSI